MVTCQQFGATKAGEYVPLYRITNSQGAYIEVIGYGAALKTVMVRDGRGQLTSVCLGYDTVAGYERGESKYGATIGRVSGRMDGARFQLNGHSYILTPNCGEHLLHGGAHGFDRQVWRSRVNGDSVIFFRVSPDGEEGFPGNLDAQVRYSFSDDNELAIEYLAETDADTLCSLTNHAYWNLGAKLDIHMMRIYSDSYVEALPSLMPSGNILPMSSSPYDYRGWSPVGKLPIDLSFPLAGEGLRQAVALRNSLNGLSMEISTTLPSIHVYTGDSLPEPRAGVAFEAQFVPNGINLKEFPSPILRVVEKWEHKTVIRFN